MKFVLVGIAVGFVIGVLLCAIDNVDKQAAIDNVDKQAAESVWCTVAEVSAVTIKGHEYIVVKGSNKGGIVHSESCPCKAGGAK